MSEKAHVMEVLRKNLEPLNSLFEDPLVNEVMVNAGGIVYAERAGEMIFIEDAGLKDVQIESAIVALAKSVNENVQANSAKTFILRRSRICALPVHLPRRRTVGRLCVSGSTNRAESDRTLVSSLSAEC